MNTETPMYVVFNSSDSQYKPLLDDLYKGNSFKECELIHKNDFNSKSFFQKKFANDLTKPQPIAEMTSKISDSFDRIAKTKVFDKANVEMSVEGEKLQMNMHITEKKKYDANFEFKPDGKNGVFLSTKLSFLCRTPFNRMDYHKFEILNGFFEKNNRKGFRLASNFPFALNENSVLKLEILQKQKFTDSNIEENSLAQKLRVVPLDKKWNFIFKHKSLQNHFNIKETSQYFLDNQIFPSDEYSFKYRRIFFDEIDQGIVNVGRKLEGDAILGLNDNYASYLKLGMKFRKYFQLFDPKTQKYPNLKYINIENISRIGLYVPLSKKQSLVNNLLNLNNCVPGFKSLGGRYPSFDPNCKENIGNYKGNQFHIINSLKINFYDYPFLKIMGVVPFAHVTGVISAEDLKDFKNKKMIRENFRVAGGIGAKFKFLAKDIEVLYNVGHFHGGKDVAAKLQILFCK